MRTVYQLLLGFSLFISSQVYAACGDEGGGTLAPFPYGINLNLHTESVVEGVSECAEYILSPTEPINDIEKTFEGIISYPETNTNTSSVQAALSVEDFNFEYTANRTYVANSPPANANFVPYIVDRITFNNATISDSIPFEWCINFSGDFYNSQFDAEIVQGWVDLNFLSGDPADQTNVQINPSPIDSQVIGGGSLTRVSFENRSGQINQQCLTGVLSLNRLIVFGAQPTPINIILSGALIRQTAIAPSNNGLVTNNFIGETNFLSSFRFTSLPDGVTCSAASGTSSACGGGTTNPNPTTYPYNARPSKCPVNDCTSVGNPINFSLGFKHQTETDYANGLLSFTRYYRSDAEWYSNSVGQRWRHNFDRSIVVTDSIAEITTEDGLIYHYQNDGNGNWSITEDDNDLTASLQETSDGYLFITEADHREFYNTEGRLIRVETPYGNTVDLTYDTQNRLTTITDEKSRALNITYAGDSQYVQSLVTPDGTFIYDYDVNNNLITVTQPDTQARTYHYENSDFVSALTGITDENAVRLSTYTYNDEGRPISSEQIGGANNYSIAYNDDGSITTTNPLGKQTTYHFETIKGVRRIVSVEGHASANCAAANQAYSYDERGFLNRSTDWNGNVTTYVRDARGLITSMTEDSGGTAQRTITTTYTSDFRLPDVITKQGKITDYDYDVFGRVTALTVTDTNTNESRTVAYTYHPNGTDGNGQTILGKLASMDGARTDVDDTTSYEYDDAFNLIAVTSALGHRTRTTSFDAAGRPLIQFDANDIETRFTYDPLGRLTQTIEAFGSLDQATTDFIYDQAGNLTQTIFANGVTLTYQYDDAQRLIGIEDALGNTITYTLDAAGNRTQEVYRDDSDTLRYSITQAFDELSRLLQTTDANTDTISYAYDLNSNLTSMVDGNTNTTQFVFDGLDRLVTEIDALNGEISNGFNALDQNINVNDPRSNQTDYSYNAFGDLVSQTSSDTGTTNFTYDPAGNRLSQTDARGIVTNYSYDVLNRLVTKTYPSDPSLNITYVYDAGADCGASIGRLCDVTHAGGIRAYRYDDLGRMIETTNIINNVRFSTQYIYDAAGTVTSVIYPSGRTVNHTLNDNGQIQAIDLDGNPIAFNIEYLPFGGVERLTYNNDITLTNRYNQAYQLENRVIANGNIDTLYEQAYQYDMAGNLLTTTDAIYGDATYDYDALYRLNSEDSASGVYGFEYDAVGNRLRQTINANAITYDYPVNNQHLIAANDQTYAYDANGNLTDNGTLQLTYAANNRLQTLQSNTATANYTYNDLQQRIVKTVAPSNTQQETLTNLEERATFYQNLINDNQASLIAQPANDNERLDNLRHERLINLYNERIGLAQTQIAQLDISEEDHRIFIYDQTGLMLGEYTPQGDVILEYAYLNGEPLAQIAANDNITYFHTDHLGTPRVASNDNAETVWEWQSDAFGNGAPSGSETVPLRFAGQYYDPESGLYYNWNRYYDPALGRYITSDPIGLDGGINTYGYALQNPIIYLDADGLQTIKNGKEKFNQIEAINSSLRKTITNSEKSLNNNPYNYLTNDEYISNHSNNFFSYWIRDSVVPAIDAAFSVVETVASGCKPIAATVINEISKAEVVKRIIKQELKNKHSENKATPLSNEEICRINNYNHKCAIDVRIGIDR